MYPLLFFLLFPYANDNRSERFPVVTLALIFANLLAFAAQAWLVLRGQGAVVEALIYRPGESSWYSLVTYAFLHADPLHLLFNLWFLWLIGGQVEQRTGRLWFPLFYLGGGLCAAFGHALYCSVLPPEVAVAAGESAKTVGIIGASGCVYAVLGAYFILYPFEEFRFWYFMFMRWGTIRIATVFFVTYKALGDVFLAWTAASYGLVTTVANWAHLGGLVYGVGVALAVFGSYALTGRERLTQDEILRRRRFRRIARRKFYSDGLLPEPMSEKEFEAATDDITPAEAIRRGLFFHNGRMIDWGYQEMLIENPETCLEPSIQLEMIDVLMEHGREGLAEVAAWNLLEAYPRTPEAIQARFILGRMLTRLPEMRGTAKRLLREFLACEPAMRERLEAERLVRKLDERPLWQWKPKKRKQSHQKAEG